MRRLILVLGVLALAATACGNKVEKGNYKTDSGLSTAPECPKTAVTATANAGKKPEITIKNDNCSPPKTLLTTTVIPGKGAIFKGGDIASIQYVGISWSTKKQFDASWDHGGKPFETQIPGQLIAGWNEAIPGMHVGERRILIIPPDKGYGGTGAPGGAIAPNETLVFVVDLVGTKPAPKPTQSNAPGSTPSGKNTTPGKAKGTPTGGKPKPKKSVKPTPVLSKVPTPTASPSHT